MSFSWFVVLSEREDFVSESIILYYAKVVKYYFAKFSFFSTLYNVYLLYRFNVVKYLHLIYICEYLSIAPQDFFDEGVAEPVLIQKAIDGLLQLSDKELLSLLSIIDRFVEHS